MGYTVIVRMIRLRLSGKTLVTPKEIILLNQLEMI